MIFAFQFLSIFIICSFFLAWPTLAKYTENDTVTLWVNKAGPYNNPQETYSYYSLPFCRPADVDHKRGGLGEVLGGNDLIDSRIDIKFKRDVEKRSICGLKLDASKIAQFKYAIDNSYWFQFFMDDLPIWGLVGYLHPDRNGDSKHVLFTHMRLDMHYNTDQVPVLFLVLIDDLQLSVDNLTILSLHYIIYVQLSQEIPKQLEEGRVLDMTYSVKWAPTNVCYARRFNVYLNSNFF